MTIPTICVLVTDDEPLTLSAVSRLLASVGYEVITAINGEQTLQLAEMRHPDLLLLDVVLPDIEGTEICRRIKADPRTADIFVILLSGSRTGSDDQAKGMEGGADGYIARPIANRELLARIQAYLRIKTAEQALKKYSWQLEDMVAERTHQLHEAQEQLVHKEKLAVMGQLAGSVGHELRNPLGVINSAVYYLKMVQPDANEKIKQYHAMIEREVHNADKIIADLLDFARGVTAECKPVAIPELVQGVLERFPAPAAVHVSVEFPSDLPLVFADPRQVEQVLGNLVINACQAMKDGGKLTVDGGQLTVDGISWVRIAVKDTGTGITPENLKKLFEPLFTTKAKGIGLGLVVSKKLIEANGGRIEVESEPGKGSTFTLYLPVQEDKR